MAVGILLREEEEVAELQRWTSADRDVRHDPAISEEVVRGTWGTLFPEGEIEVMGNCGHYPMLETPPRLAAVVERFLARALG